MAGLLEIKSEYILKSFEESKKHEGDTLVVESCHTSRSRSKCGMVKGLITNPKGATPVFIKFTPCNWETKRRQDLWGTTLNASKNSPAYSEIQFFRMLDAFHDKNICDTFVKSHNSEFVKSDITKVKGYRLIKNNKKVYGKVNQREIPDGGRFYPSVDNADLYYSMLITQPLQSGFNELWLWIDQFQAKLRKLKMSSQEFKAVLFQVIYAISCMSTIRMAHMDLHFGNIFVKIDEGLRGRYKAFEFKNHKGVYETAYIPAHVIVKIIDLDGAYKFEAGNDVAPEFRKHIPNVQWSGDIKKIKRPNPRANVMKVMYHLSMNGRHLRSAFKNIVDKNGKIPFLEKNIRNPLQQIMMWDNRHSSFVNDYGILINYKGAMIDMGDEFVKHPSELLHLLNRGPFKKKPTLIPVMSSVSQKGIFMKEPIPIAKSPKVVKAKRPKKTLVKPRPIKPPSPSPRPGSAKRKSPSKPQNHQKRSVPKLNVNNAPLLVVPKITPSMVMKLRGLKQEVDAKCSNGPGRPKAPCADALRRHKEACKLDKTRVYKKRDCVPRGKPGAKPGAKRPVVNNGINYEKIKQSAAKKVNIMNDLIHRKGILCKPRGRPGPACKDVLEQMKLLCAKKEGHVFKSRECIPKPVRRKPSKKI
tara:strand:+ start:2386 stop:4305 length:1920 start_codon:yes stop_codon:yes gene_type:complete